MNSTQTVKNLLVSIIESIDMYNFLLKDHHCRTAVIAYHLGNTYGLNNHELHNLVLAASIHDIGALHIQERDKLLYIDAVDPESHEIFGAHMLEGFPPFDEIRQIIRHHHINYEDVKSGKIPESEVPLACYFLHLADRIDVLNVINSGAEDCYQFVADNINQRFGTTFHPQLKPVFNELYQENVFSENTETTFFHQLLFNSLDSDTYELTDSSIEALATIFARIVDYKSPWTSTHSLTVGLLAKRIGELLLLPNKTCFELKIAGFLHDIGKIAIPAEILEKPDQLDDEEKRIMKSHATYSSLILSKIGGFEHVAKWGSNHHEKRDRSGYPLGKSDKDFTIEMDIIAFADIFSALAENRPYRKAYESTQLMEKLGTLSPNQLSPVVYRCIESNFNELYGLFTSASHLKVS